MNTFNGMKIVESPLIAEVPKLQLSHDFTACSDAMKKHMNDWLREMFGTYLPCYVIGGDTIAMHPKHVAMLRMQNDMYNAEFRPTARTYRAGRACNDVLGAVVREPTF